ncbi:MAG: LptF/LptG family permease [Planctomycetota bacterium]|nr:LptF/LptG family permease [Planctomycetota bacterium]
MTRRAPVTLWKYVATDLWRLLLLTVAVLVTVIAFAAAVKPLADGKLGPVEAIKFMVLAVPPMLAYALPFSAGFAATLAYHRMAQDNELLAAHAGGIAHRSLLMPALATGAALFITLAALNEYMIPRFLQSMERLIAQDLTKLMVSSIERGHAIEQNGLMVAADDVLVPTADQLKTLRAQGIADALELRSVVFVDTDSDGRIKNSLVTSKAEVYVIPSSTADGRSQRVASIIVTEGFGTKENGDSGWFEQLPTIALPIPDAFKDDPKFLTWGELRDLRNHPDRMDFVKTKSTELAYYLARRATTGAMLADLRASGKTNLKTRAHEQFVIRASSIRWDRDAEVWVVAPLPGTQTIDIEWWRNDDQGTPGGAGITRISAKAATFRASIAGQGEGRELTINLELRDARVQNSGTEIAADIDAQPGSVREVFPIHGLRLSYDPLSEYTAMDAHQLLEIAEPRVNRERNPDTVLARPTHRLRDEVENLQREITSKQHERWALASACLIMVITGAVMAVKLRDAQPLHVYLWSFFPALASIITIMSGQQLTHKSGNIGLLLLWAGVAGLAAFTFGTFLSIRKH